MDGQIGVHMNIDEEVATVKRWFDETDDKNKAAFLECPKDQLIRYHNSLGRSIRNEFKLWRRNWKPDLYEGIDMSTDHPDAVSMEIIERVWEELNGHI